MFNSPQDPSLDSQPTGSKPSPHTAGSTLKLVPTILLPRFETSSQIHSFPQVAERLAGPPRTSARCGEKGCVFPAGENGSGLCSHHLRQQLEPAFFSSWQPSWLLAHRPVTAYDRSRSAYHRSYDRRRLAAQRVIFQQGVA